MSQAAEMEVRSVAGRDVKVRWKSSRFGEWLAWCYLPAESLLPNEGVGFEARAATAEAAKQELIAQVEAYLARAAA